MPNVLTIEEFNAYISQLGRHDWYFDYSDDYGVFRRGADSYTNLRLKAKQHLLLNQAMVAWSNSMFNSGSMDFPTRTFERNKAIDLLRQQIQNPMPLAA